MASTKSPTFTPSVRETMLMEQYKGLLKREVAVLVEQKRVIEELWELQRNNR